MGGTQDNRDIVIVGGGIGGSALATVMAKAGHSVLLLEKTTKHVDRVRGEWMAPWGVNELMRLGLYDAMMAAGGHHLTRSVRFDEFLPPDAAMEMSQPITEMLPGVPGPMCLGHPAMCDVLNAEAKKAGVEFLRDVSGINVTPGATPKVSYKHEGVTRELSARLVVGADGRASTVRKQIGIELEYDPVGHFFSGMLIEGAKGLPADTQWIGTEGDVHYLCFPQSDTRARLYLGFSPDTPSRFSGKDGPARFLDAFNLKSTPFSECFADATPAGPCPAYPNSDSWTPKPYAKGVILVGDAAGHNDPINGQGLSVTLRDIRIIRDLLLGSQQWTEALFDIYAKERMERMRRMRFMSRVHVEIACKFSPEAAARRGAYGMNAGGDPEGKGAWLGGTLMVGPDMMPDEAFTKASWDWHLSDGVPFPEESLGPTNENTEEQ